MIAPFRLKKTIGEDYSMDLEDSLNTKRALARTGHLDEPEDGFDEFPDRPMIDAVKSFQRDQGLPEDGVMKPDGPTLERLNESLDRAQSPAAAAAGGAAEDPASLLRTPAEPGDSHDRHLAGLPARPGARPAARGRRPDKPDGVEVAALPLAAPIVYGALRLAAGEALRLSGGAAGAATLGALLGVLSGEEEKPTGAARTDIAPPLPPLPGYDPADAPLPDRTESPNEPVELPDLSGPLPAPQGPTIFVLPAPEPGEFGDGIVERKGNEATRKELERIRDYFVTKGWKHIAGGRCRAGDPALSEPGATQKPGDERGEFHVPGHFGGLKGGHFTDLTFEMPDGRKVHIQSVDVDRNGKPTQRELDNAEKIRRAEKNTDVILIPKGTQLERLKQRLPKR